MVKKARAAGSFIGALFNNPTFLIIGALGITLFIFKDRISEFFAGLKFPEIPPIELPTINLPTINLPEFPEINFPEFPDFAGFFEQQQQQTTDFLSGLQLQFNNLFGGTIPQPQRMVENTGLLSQTELDLCQCGSSVIQDAFGNVTQFCKECAPTPQRNPALDREPSDAELFAREDQQITPAQQFQQDKIEAGEAPPVQSFLIDDPTQQFGSGGLSFIGGSIFETQITGESTLSFIINQLGVTASQAASIRAELRGFTQEEALFLAPKVITPFGTVFDAAGGGGGGVNVSDQQFAGLTPQQIFLQLTGGNISNF